MNEVHATPKQSKTWAQVEEEVASLIKKEETHKQHKTALNSIYSAQRWRILKVMDELEKNSFVKMWTEGWCTSCEFDSSKCAEQHECEAFKTVNKVMNKGSDSDEETI